VSSVEKAILWSGIALGLLFGLVIWGIPFSLESYKRGQLDYQKGIVQYELTEDGYKEITKTK